jgi:predicted trehalose synthase
LLGKVDGAPYAVALDLNAEDPMKLAEVGNLYMLAQAVLEVIDEADGGGSHGAVINVHGDDSELTLALVPLEEDSLIDFALAEVEGQEDGA